MHRMESVGTQRNTQVKIIESLFFFLQFDEFLNFRFCRFEEPRSHLLHEQLATGLVFYKQFAEMRFQNAHGGR